jgi:Cu(I)/Ag(I) efflux system membrane fusion protein/cobalt-zinc-cadmium efflux system membrane fusion protein
MYGGSKEFAGSQAASATGAASAPAAKISLQTDNTPLKAGEDNVFRVSVTGADGKPLSDAQVKVTMTMPAMPAMGMPEMKSTIELPWLASQHMYVGKGQPGMSGSWNVAVEASKNGAAIATFHTHLSAK